MQWPQAVPGGAEHRTEGTQTRPGGGAHPRPVLPRLWVVLRQEGVWVGRPMPRRAHQRGKASTCQDSSRPAALADTTRQTDPQTTHGPYCRLVHGQEMLRTRGRGAGQQTAPSGCSAPVRSGPITTRAGSSPRRRRQSDSSRTEPAGGERHGDGNRASTVGSYCGCLPQGSWGTRTR